MTVQTKTPDIAVVRAVDINAGTGTLTCAWVRADDGALVMQWTGQTPEDTRQEMAKAA
jgi:hypothetical protein